jgi:hypothetical protein
MARTTEAGTCTRIEKEWDLLIFFTPRLTLAPLLGFIELVEQGAALAEEFSGPGYLIYIYFSRRSPHERTAELFIEDRPGLGAFCAKQFNGGRQLCENLQRREVPAMVKGSGFGVCRL